MFDLQQHGTLLGHDHRGREVYRLETSTGYMLVHPCGEVYMVQEHNRGDTVANIFWRLEKAEYLEKAVVRKIECSIVAQRMYGEPKMVKPSALKNIPQAFSVQWNRRCKCACYIQGENLWIKHRDFFSADFRPPAKDAGKPASYISEKYFGKPIPEKFLYADSWSSIILRGEAWICFSGVLHLVRNNSPLVVIRSMQDTFAQVVGDTGLQTDQEWSRFFENVAVEAKKYIEQPEAC